MYVVVFLSFFFLHRRELGNSVSAKCTGQAPGAQREERKGGEDKNGCEKATEMAFTCVLLGPVAPCTAPSRQ